MNTENKYYVYVYLDPRKEGLFKYDKYEFKNEPFYIGKGTGKRYLKHLYQNKNNCENIFKFRVIEKIKNKNLKPIILKIEKLLNEDDAYILETKLISLMGRRCDESGILTNILVNIKPPNKYICLSKETINKIIDLYNKGWYVKHIGNHLNLNELKIKKTLIENGINVKRKPPTNYLNLSDNLINDICYEYKNGLSIRKLCEKYKLSFEVVRRRLRENNVKLRDYHYKKTKEHVNKISTTRKKSNLVGEKCALYIKLKKEVKVEIIKLRTEEYLTIKKIAKELNLTYGKVYATMKELGLSTKNIKNGR